MSPVRSVPGRGMNMIVRFPSLKMKRMVAFESLIEQDYLYLLDYERDVTAFEEQPCTLEYHVDEQTLVGCGLRVSALRLMLETASCRNAQRACGTPAFAGWSRAGPERSRRRARCAHASAAAWGTGRRTANVYGEVWTGPVAPYSACPHHRTPQIPRYAPRRRALAENLVSRAALHS